MGQGKGGGPKPKPNEIKVLTGSRHVNENPVICPTDLPEPPEHLDSIAREEWDRVIDGLTRVMGISNKMDQAALAAYCVLYSRWVNAEEALRRTPLDPVLLTNLVITTTNGNVVQNPLVGAANKAAADLVKYAAEFGMTPSARARLSPGKAGSSDPAEEFFEARTA